MSNTIGAEKSANGVQNPTQNRPKGQQNDQFLKMLPFPPDPTLLSRIGQSFQDSKGKPAHPHPGDHAHSSTGKHVQAYFSPLRDMIEELRQTFEANLAWLDVPGHRSEDGVCWHIFEYEDV